MLAGSENVKFVDNVYPARTDTMDLKLTQLEKIEDETILKIIMNEMPVDEFDSFVTNWYAQGGQEITDEVNEMYGN
jgi:putative aldouronate transport system substrate-binding protein